MQASVTVTVAQPLLLVGSVAGSAEVGPDDAGVGPVGRVLRELRQELDAALDEQGARLPQPRALAGVAQVALRVQQEVLHQSICMGRQRTSEQADRQTD